MSWLRVSLSAEGAKNVSWPWLSPLRGWGSLTMALTGKFVYIYIYIYQIKSEDKNFNFQIIRASATYVASIYKQQNISRRLTFEEWFYWYQQARVPLVQPLIHKCLKNSLWLVIIVVICLPKFCTQYRQGVHYFLETKFNVFSRFFT